MIDYRTKLTLHRQLYPFNDLEYSIESDRGRILSSPAFRRLQKRTQVFALELNASIRTRLTHSLEVAQTARFIAKSILTKLSEKGLDTYGLEGMENAFVSTAEMTSLLHDIGNPPFGHFAEETINKWMSTHALPLLDAVDTSTETIEALKNTLKTDIVNYDGNAQAIRLISKLQRLNLSYSQTLAVLKYTRGAYEPKPSSDDPQSYLRKKPGYYYSERDYVKTLQESLGVAAGHRFPLTYIMEAADDISYLTADLEDSVEKGILNLDQVYDLIRKACEEENEHYLLDLIQDKYEKAKRNEAPYQFNMFFTLTRAQLVRELVGHVVDIYVAHHEAIYEGSFNSALLEYDRESDYYKAIHILKKISTKYIYQNREVQTLELQGYTIVNGLLDLYKPLLEICAEDFSKLLRDEKIECFVAMRLIRRISSKQIVAYQADVDSIDTEDQESFVLLELYYRIRLLTDYISGMTDDFALNEYQTLMAL
ncbi:dGTPase [Sulfuricurvum sp.]|uniref:dGTPase n=1 Tax=Sulfuricurvum sp. TaxID=2025608 RepID=UPI0026070CAC|nr:dGTPase [Sulfuricurvum sp.]MDD4950775.1 dGTPase [Sulfuricurvum sp.]